MFFRVTLPMLRPKKKHWYFYQFNKAQCALADSVLILRLARKGMTSLPEDHIGASKRLFLGFDGTLVMGVLPVSVFASGHAYFVSRMHEQLDLKPYVVHATFQYSGTPGKRNRMREFMLWNDKPGYYDHEVCCYAVFLFSFFFFFFFWIFWSCKYIFR